MSDIDAVTTRERTMMMRTRLALGLAAMTGLLAACGGDGDGNDSLLTGFSAVVIVVIIVVVILALRRRR